jgi:hypothetical protein
MSTFSFGQEPSRPGFAPQQNQQQNLFKRPDQVDVLFSNNPTNGYGNGILFGGLPGPNKNPFVEMLEKGGNLLGNPMLMGLPRDPLSDFATGRGMMLEDSTANGVLGPTGLSLSNPAGTGFSVAPGSFGASVRISPTTTVFGNVDLNPERSFFAGFNYNANQGREENSSKQADVKSSPFLNMNGPLRGLPAHPESIEYNPKTGVVPKQSNEAQQFLQEELARLYRSIPQGVSPTTALINR